MSYSVTGKIVFNELTGDINSATVYIRLLDTTEIDVSSITVAAVVLHDLNRDRVESQGLPFRISIDQIDSTRRYEISVLVDLDGDGQISVGDYYSTQSYPVLTHGHPDMVTIQVQKI